MITSSSTPLTMMAKVSLSVFRHTGIILCGLLVGCATISPRTVPLMDYSGRVPEAISVTTEEIVTEVAKISHWTIESKSSPYVLTHQTGTSFISIGLTIETNSFMISHLNSSGFRYDPEVGVISETYSKQVSELRDIVTDVMLSYPIVFNKDYCFSQKGIKAKGLAKRLESSIESMIDAEIRLGTRGMSSYAANIFREQMESTKRDFISTYVPAVRKHEKQQLAVEERNQCLKQLDALESSLLDYVDSLTGFKDRFSQADDGTKIDNFNLIFYGAARSGSEICRFYDETLVLDLFSSKQAHDLAQNESLRRFFYKMCDILEMRGKQDVILWMLDLPRTKGQPSGTFVAMFALTTTDVDSLRVKYEDSTKNNVTAKPHVTYGTGFIVSSMCIATCWHVVENATNIVCVLPGGVEIPLKLVTKDDINDIAILRLPSPLPNSNSLPISQKLMKISEKVFTIGFPLPDLMGQAQKYSEGTISSIKGFENDARLYQISAPIQPGNSGGALISDDGFVVGIVSSRLNPSAVMNDFGTLPENVNYAIKSRYLVALLEDSDIDFRKVPSENPVHSAEKATVMIKCIIQQ